MAIHKAVHVLELAARYVRLAGAASFAVPIHVGVAVQVTASIHISVLALILIRAPVFLPIFAPVKALLLIHHPIRILRQAFAHFGMVLEIVLQISVTLQEFLIVDESWILTNLLRQIRMIVEKLIEGRQLLAIQRSII